LNQRQPKPWGQVHRLDPLTKNSMVGVNSNKMRLSDNNNLVGSLFQGSAVKLSNSIVIEDNTEELTNIVHGLSSQQSIIGNHEHITVINKNVMNVTQSFDKQKSQTTALYSNK
jgi:hypothetical protein